MRIRVDRVLRSRFRDIRLRRLRAGSRLRSISHQEWREITAKPIAQFIGVGTYLVPNNLSANAHGNGYADPNLFIPSILESVQVDGGAFNVREGNHAVNVAADVWVANAT